MAHACGKRPQRKPQARGKRAGARTRTWIKCFARATAAYRRCVHSSDKAPLAALTRGQPSGVFSSLPTLDRDATHLPVKAPSQQLPSAGPERGRKKEVKEMEKVDLFPPSWPFHHQLAPGLQGAEEHTRQQIKASALGRRKPIQWKL